jgi:hypothetical protein
MQRRSLQAVPSKEGEHQRLVYRLRLLFLDRWNLWHHLTRCAPRHAAMYPPKIGEELEGGFLGKPTLKLKNLALVVPADSGLAFAASERVYLLSLANGGRQVRRIPATFVDERATLASGVYDGWHFSGHGGFRGSDTNWSRMYLENQETLTPKDLSGLVSNLGRAKPVVFFNACQIGRSAMSLTDIGGWARQFLHAGRVRLSVHTGQSTIDPPKTLLSNCIVTCSAGYRLAEQFRRHVPRSNQQAILPGWPKQCLLIR